jgi:hypothetical protein
MSPNEFTNLMQSLVRSDSMRDGNLLLEVMDEDTYRALNSLPSVSQPYQPSIENLTIDRRTPPRSAYDSYAQSSINDESYPRMRQCFIRVRRISFDFYIFFFCFI